MLSARTVGSHAAGVWRSLGHWKPPVDRELLPPDQVAQIREWLNERDEAEWDAQIERDERAGRLDALADRALAEYRAGRTRPL